jgi:carbamoyl-phosphate synthase small subunit
MPYDIEPKAILDLKPDGVIVSNGPEDDSELDSTVETVQGILGKVPILGVSTGHLVVARAAGGKIKKLKIGHRGVNYPVTSRDSYKGEITVQNHGFVVEEKSLDKSIKILETNLNDKTI